MWSDYIPILLSVISQTAMPAAWKGKTMHHVQQSGLVFYHLSRQEQCDDHEFLSTVSKFAEQD